MAQKDRCFTWGRLASRVIDDSQESLQIRSENRTRALLFSRCSVFVPSLSWQMIAFCTACPLA